jgi:hypothetical protein
MRHGTEQGPGVRAAGEPAARGTAGRLSGGGVHLPRKATGRTLVEIDRIEIFHLTTFYRAGRSCCPLSALPRVYQLFRRRGSNVQQ